MVMRFEIKGPVVPGEFSSEEMSAAFSECELSSIRFFDAEGRQVEPPTGTVTFSGSPDGENWRDIENGSFLASEAYSQSRLVPYAEGCMLRARIVLSGVTGAESFVASVWRK